MGAKFVDPRQSLPYAPCGRHDVRGRSAIVSLPFSHIIVTYFALSYNWSTCVVLPSIYMLRRETVMIRQLFGCLFLMLMWISRSDAVKTASGFCVDLTYGICRRNDCDGSDSS